MFARALVRGRVVRRTIGSFAALLALLGGVSVLVGAFPTGASGATAVRPEPILLGLGSILAAWMTRRAAKAFLFPRVRLTAAGLLAIALGGGLLMTGAGPGALLVLGGGLVALLASVV